MIHPKIGERRLYSPQPAIVITHTARLVCSDCVLDRNNWVHVVLPGSCSSIPMYHVRRIDWLPCESQNASTVTP